MNMGLSAFNRARERQAAQRAELDKQERERAEQARQADEQAVNAFVGLFPLDPEHPDFVPRILAAREICTVLTAEQREMIGVELFNKLDEATQTALNMSVKRDDTEPPEEPTNEEEQEEKTEEPAAEQKTEDKPKRTRRGG